MTHRNAEYDDALDTYEESQLDLYVNELLQQIGTMKESIESETAMVTLAWVEQTILRLSTDFKQ